MQIAEPMEDVADAADDVAQSLLFEINLPAELFFEAAPVFVESVDLASATSPFRAKMREAAR
jgi:hypothetical protein